MYAPITPGVGVGVGLPRTSQHNVYPVRRPIPAIALFAT